MGLFTRPIILLRGAPSYGEHPSRQRRDQTDPLVRRDSGANFEHEKRDTLKNAGAVARFASPLTFFRIHANSGGGFNPHQRSRGGGSRRCGVLVWRRSGL